MNNEPDRQGAEDRASLNRQVSHALARHAADLRKLSFTSSSQTVYLHGHLQKDPAGEFDMPGIRALCAELLNIRGLRALQFAVDNWEIQPSSGYVRRVVGRR